MMTQEQIIREHLEKHGHITAWEAITEYHITRLSEMIRRLRVSGMEIETEMITKNNNGKTSNFAKYVWKGETE